MNPSHINIRLLHLKQAWTWNNCMIHLWKLILPLKIRDFHRAMFVSSRAGNLSRSPMNHPRSVLAAKPNEWESHSGLTTNKEGEPPRTRIIFLISFLGFSVHFMRGERCWPCNLSQFESNSISNISSHRGSWPDLKGVIWLWNSLGHSLVIPGTLLLVLEGGPTKKSISVIYVYIYLYFLNIFILYYIIL